MYHNNTIKNSNINNQTKNKIRSSLKKIFHIYLLLTNEQFLKSVEYKFASNSKKT